MACIDDTASINLSVAASQLSADLIVDPGAGLSPNPLVVNPTGVYVVGSDGWIPLPTTLAFSSADGHTYVATTSADLRTFIIPGDKIRLVQSGVAAYFFVTAIAAGTITLYGGLNYVLAATPVTLPYFSKAKSPAGFPLDLTAWTETLIDSVDRTQVVAVASTWYNPGSLSKDIPIGSWRVRWEAVVSVVAPERVRASLSTVNNGSTDGEFTVSYRPPSGAIASEATMGRSKSLTLSAKTTYFLVIQNLTGTTTIGFLGGSLATTVIRAELGYL